MNKTQPVAQTDFAVTFTERAIAQAKTLMAQDPANAGKCVRIFAEGGCCSGMEYGLVFDDPRADDQSASLHGVTVIVDPDSARCLRGSQVDYEPGPGESGFRITQPNPPSACGCDCGQPSPA
jgi:iron-sulfur cluster assembly accessory protein